MKFFVILLILIGFTGVIIPHAYASCIENEDWPDTPCLDMIVNGWYPQHLVDKWSDYYSYKGSIFMEEKYLELSQSIKEDGLQEWVDESMTHRSVYEYYFFSGRAPNTGEYHGQFDVIKINEENIPEHSEMMGISLISYGHQWILKIILIIIILIAMSVGIFVSIKIWRKRK